MRSRKHAPSIMANGLPSCSRTKRRCAVRSDSRRVPALPGYAVTRRSKNADFRAERGLDRSLFLKLAGCDWIRQRHGLLITGPAGVGKSWLACALGHKACRDDFSVAYHRAPRLFAALALARGDGRYARMLKALARTDLLILDDWGPEKLNDEQRRDLLEIVEDRYERRSTIVTSQVPVDHWYEIIGNPTIADAILDRLVHNAYRIELTGESMRKRRAPENPEAAQA